MAKCKANCYRLKQIIMWNDMMLEQYYSVKQGVPVKACDKMRKWATMQTENWW